jgi:hypothetical protein
VQNDFFAQHPGCLGSAAGVFDVTARARLDQTLVICGGERGTQQRMLSCASRPTSALPCNFPHAVDGGRRREGLLGAAAIVWTQAMQRSRYRLRHRHGIMSRFSSFIVLV